MCRALAYCLNSPHKYHTQNPEISRMVMNSRDDSTFRVMMLETATSYEYLFGYTRSRSKTEQELDMYFVVA